MPPNLPAALIETILTRLAALFLAAAGDPAAARAAAYELLVSYRPETTSELRHAANIILFSFQAIEALAQATTPEMSLNRILRLRGSAVSLNREAAKSERLLTQLQQARRNPPEAQPAEAQPEQEPAQPAPKTEKAAAIILETGTVGALAKAKGITWTQAYNLREREKRLAARQQRQSHSPPPVTNRLPQTPGQATP